VSVSLCVRAMKVVVGALPRGAVRLPECQRGCSLEMKTRCWQESRNENNKVAGEVHHLRASCLYFRLISSSVAPFSISSTLSASELDILKTGINEDGLNGDVKA
jgi:hypothetical protein